MFHLRLLAAAALLSACTNKVSGAGGTDTPPECEAGATRLCGIDAGECRAGVESCDGGSWSGVCAGQATGGQEVCDGLDNDCDGTVDLGCPCSAGAMRPCGTDEGACEAGIETCSNGAWSGACDGEVAPTAEVCDGLDNDCDGRVDLGCPCSAGETQPCGSDEGACVAGNESCAAGAWSGICDGEVVPAEEACDGLDNDCDGAVDQGCPCSAGDSRACGSNEGTCIAGVESCLAGAWSGLCDGDTPPVDESCDGLDNDCDGDIDETCDCTDGDVQTCGDDTGECQAGEQTCAGGRWGDCAGAIGPAAEQCDGLDNACTGAPDEGCDDDGDRRCDAGMLVIGTPAICPDGPDDCDDADINNWASCAG